MRSSSADSSKFLSHEYALDRAARRHTRLPASYLDEAVRTVEVHTGKRCFDLDACCAGLDRMRFGLREERRANAMPRCAATHIDGGPMPLPFDAVVAGESKDGAPAVDVSDGDEEHFSAVHRLEIELAFDGFLPPRDD